MKLGRHSIYFELMERPWHWRPSWWTGVGMRRFQWLVFAVTWYRSPCFRSMNTTMLWKDGQMRVALERGDEMLESVLLLGLSEEQAYAVMDIAHLSAMGSVPRRQQDAELAYYRRMKARR